MKTKGKRGMGQRNFKYFLIGLFAAAAMIILVCIYYANSLKSTSKSEIERYLSELSNSVSFSIEARAQANIAALKATALTYAEQSQRGIEDMAYLQKKADLYSFVRISILSPDGKSVGSDGTSYDFSQEPEIMKVFEGEEIIANGTEAYAGTKNGFYYAVPVYDSNGDIMCALVTSNTSDWINDLLSKEYFGGKGFFHIIDGDGTVVIRSENPAVIFEGDNFIEGMQKENIVKDEKEFAKFRENVQNGEKGILYFREAGDRKSDEKIACSVNIENIRFSLILVVTDGAASNVFEQLLKKGMGVILFVASALIIMLFIVFFSYKEANAKLFRLAFVDPVTAGYTGTRFEIEAEELIDKNPMNTYALVVLNVMKFKLINDAYGMEEGNRTLEYIYRVIDRNLGEDELVARGSADRFELLIKANDKARIVERIDTLVKEINAYNAVRTDKYYLNFQVGVYMIKDDNIRSVVYIRDRANTARQNAGQVKGARLFVCNFYSDREHERLFREKDMENRMENALENGEFVVYLQPKLDLSNNKIAGAEALIRWHDPEKGMISPDEFIPFFEKKGFIVNIDLYVFEQVCRLLRKWIDEGKPLMAISVNLSRVHLHNKNFIENFVEIRDRYQIPEGLLEIELTETMLVNEAEDIKGAVEEIHRAGFSCSIDDFGSGYSSLNLLKEIEADVLKIDKAFFGVDNSVRSREKAIVKSVVELAQNLEMKAISEGVETSQQLKFLREIKCDMVQGYIISRPVPIGEFEKMIFHNRDKSDV